MRSGLEERRERGSFGLSTAVGRLDNQTLKGVGFLSDSKASAKVCRAMPPLRSELTRVFRLSGAKLPIPTELLAGCRQFAPDPSPKRGLTIRGMFTTSERPSRSCAQPGSPAPESDK
jgi:hypothetical protein